MEQRGIVYLIGGGPGDPGLITVKGLQYLKAANVIVYDYLAPQSLLQEARSDAERIYVGKSAGNHAMPQEAINALLVEKAKAGKIVARLKGGDPFMFGRGGEEAEALVDAGLLFEVVPGVTSPIAVPAYAGIPITHRDFTTSFAVITGHEDPTKEQSTIAWDKIATGIGTLVFLMGVGNLPTIVAQLIKHGRAASTPVAVIRWGTTPRQETVSGTLADIVEKSQAAGIKPPAITVVGEVVALRDRLAWFDKRPLFGKRVLVTRAAEQAPELCTLLEQYGAETRTFSVIRIGPPKDWTPLDATLGKLDSYTWAIFTSVNGVRYFAERLEHADLDWRALKGVKLAAIGPATAEALRRFGLRLDFIPGEYVAEGILAGLGDVQGQRFLLPRADIARETLTVELRNRGAEVDEVDAYQTFVGEAKDRDVVQLLTRKEVDVITFTSSSTVLNFLAMLQGTDPVQALAGVTLACIGPVTAQTLKEQRLIPTIVAREYTMKGLTEAIVAYYTTSILEHAL